MTIDELVVVLALDTKKFTEGQRQAIAAFKKTQEEAKRHGKDIEEQTRRSGEVLEQFAGRVGRYIAGFASVGAITNFVRTLTVADAEIGRTARSIGMSAQSLAAWRHAITRIGGDAGEITGFIQGLVHQFNTLAMMGRGGEFIGWFRAIGVQVADDVGNLRDMNTVLQEVNVALQTISAPRAATFLSHLGAGQGVVNLLTQTPAALQASLDRAREIGAATDANILSAQNLQAAWADLGQAGTALGRVLGSDLFPILTRGADILTRFLTLWRSERQSGAPPTMGPLGQSWLRGLVRMAVGAGPAGSRGTVVGGEASGGAAAAGGGPQAALRIRGNAQGAGSSHAGTMALAQSLQSEIPGLREFTSMNDRFHQGRPSAHNRGLALDFTIQDPSQAAAVSQRIRARLAEMGISATVLDEYSRPSPFSTGGHIHVQFNSAADAQRYAGARGAIAEAGQTAPSVPQVPLSPSVAGGGGQVGGNVSSSVNIGTINVVTQATDAPGIARDIRGAVERDSFATQADTGPSG